MNCVPNLLKIYAKIVMNQTMSHSNDFSPRQFGMSGTKLFRKFRCGFANNFDCFCNGKLSHPILLKLFIRAIIKK